MKLIRWLFAGAFELEHRRGYDEAIRDILLLPEKIYLNQKGASLRITSPATIMNSSIVGGEPGIFVEAGAEVRG